MNKLIAVWYWFLSAVATILAIPCSLLLLCGIYEPGFSLLFYRAAFYAIGLAYWKGYVKS